MVKHGKNWGTVCDDNIDDGSAKAVRVAQSACHTLGYSGGSITTYGASGPDGPTMMDDVDCASSTMNFLECSHVGSETENCDHNEDVLLECT